MGLSPRSPAPPEQRALALGLVLALAVALCVVAGCHRSKGVSEQEAALLKITRYRYNIDGGHKTARVMAEITNLGTTPVKAVPVKTILRGSDGTARGQNTVTVAEIPPGASRPFSVEIPTHGRECDVDFRIGPEALNDEADLNENAEENAAQR